MAVRIAAVVAFALLASASSVTPPLFPTQFEADITVVNDGRTATGRWFWSVGLKAERFDLEDDRGKVVEINDFAAGVRYEVWTTADQPAAHCTQRTIPKEMPAFNFSSYSFGGSRKWHTHIVNVWYHESSAARMEYLVDANTTSPVQIGVRTPSEYEGIYFNAYHAGPQPASVFQLSSVFNGTCSKNASSWQPAISMKKPLTPQAGGVADVVYFANHNWMCADVACDQTVKQGQFQPNYECAEFVSRSLIYGGYITGLSWNSPQSALQNVNHGGRTYDLLWVSSKEGGPLGLEDILVALGWHDVGAINAGTAVFVVGAEGPFSHTGIGVGPGAIDAHNAAAYNVGSIGSINRLLSY